MPNVRRTSLNLNLELVERAKAELGTRGTTDTIHGALEEVVRHARIQQLIKWTTARFSEPPPDGYQDWNDWIESLEEQGEEPS